MPDATGRISYILGLPAYRGEVHVGHCMQAVQLQTYSYRPGSHPRLAHVAYADTCSIDWARNVLMYQSAYPEVADGQAADWLLMSDADTYHGNAEDVTRMIAYGEASGAAVIAAPVKLRRRGGYNVCVIEPDKGERFLDLPELRGRVTQVSRIGTAMMAVNLNWLRANWPLDDKWNDDPWFSSRQIVRDGKPGWLGEDYAFCDGVGRRGGIVLCDGRFEPTHVHATEEHGVMQPAPAWVVTNG